MLLELVLFAILVFALGAMISVKAQTSGSANPLGVAITSNNEPLYKDYRGVTIGMTADEARQKLGEPADKSDAQDFYNFSDTESAQIFYDASRRVMAVSAHYVGLTATTPTAKAVFGADVQPRADGSVYQLVKYPRAGYWVSFSRTAGEMPVITVSMQKTR